MDIQKEKKAIKNLKAFYMEDWNLTEEERDDLDNLVSRIVAVVKTEAQAVPEWIDYTKQSPRIDGRYQIFISGEQITADWQSPFGFLDPVEGEALIQDLISHWGMLPEPPKPQEPTND